MRQTGDIESALRLVDTLLERYGDSDIKLINAKGSYLMRLKRYQEALPILEKAESLAPMNLKRMENMVDLYMEVNQPDQSVKMSKDLIKLTPEKGELKFSIYNKLVEAGFGQQARSLCSETTMPEEIVRHYNNKGVAAAKAGQFTEAMKHYQQALFFYPKSRANFKIYINIALAEIHQKGDGYLERALKAINQCLHLNPECDKAAKIKEKLEAVRSKGESHAA